MQRVLFLMPFFAVLLAGCEESPEMRAKREHAVERAQEAGAAAGEYTAEVKDELVKNFRIQLAELDQQVEVLRVKAKEAQKEAQPQIDEQLKRLEVQREKAQKQLDHLGSKSQEAWAELKSGMDGALSELKAAIDKAGDSFK